MDPIERMCLVTLTEEEVVARADSMALEELKAEAIKAERKQLNAQIAEHTTQRQRYARTIEARAELRPVLCHWHAHKSELVLVRSDTREEVERRPMTEEDRQLELPGLAARAKAKAAKAKAKAAAKTKPAAPVQAKAKSKPAAKAATKPAAPVKAKAKTATKPTTKPGTKKKKPKSKSNGVEPDLAAVAVLEAAELAQADIQH